MKTLRFVLLLSCCSALIAPEASAQSDHDRSYPEGSSECLTLPKGESGVEAGFYRVVGNSVYKVNMWNDCAIKIFDVPFPVQGVDLIQWGWEELLLFWSDQTVYRCRVDGDSLERINAEGLLSGFLFSPIERASVVEGYSGCGGGRVDNVSHDAVEVDVALPSLLHEVRSAEERPVRVRRINGVDLEELTWALRSVNTDPWRAPSVAEIELDAGDLQAYMERLAGDLEIMDDEDPFAPTPTRDDSDIFTTLPARLDTLSPELTRAALIAHRTRWRSTSSYSYGITLVNAMGDTLHCSFASDGPSQPFCLPWTLRYGDKEFRSYSVELARLLMGLLSPNEYRTERVEKVDMLYAIAAYLGEVRSRREGKTAR